MVGHAAGHCWEMRMGRGEEVKFDLWGEDFWREWGGKKGWEAGLKKAKS